MIKSPSGRRSSAKKDRGSFYRTLTYRPAHSYQEEKFLWEKKTQIKKEGGEGKGRENKLSTKDLGKKKSKGSTQQTLWPRNGGVAPTTE